MKKYKKMIATILSSSLLMGTTVFAGERNLENISNPYVEKAEEELQIEGINYRYEYGVEKGNKVTYITNEKTKEKDKLVYDETEGIFLLNGEKIAEIEKTEEIDRSVENGNYYQNRASKYNYVGTVNNKVTWKRGVAVAAAAAVIAAVMVSVTGAEVIGKIGYNAVKSFAQNGVGGRVKSKIYEMKAGKITNYKHIWSFTTNSGIKYGDYTSYITV